MKSLLVLHPCYRISSALHLKRGDGQLKQIYANFMCSIWFVYIPADQYICLPSLIIYTRRHQLELKQYPFSYYCLLFTLFSCRFSIWNKLPDNGTCMTVLALYICSYIYVGAWKESLELHVNLATSLADAALVFRVK